MANKKYKLTDGNMWATDGIHDFGQNKTQRTINSEVNSALGGKAPTNHASTATTYGAASTSNYGHVKLSNTTPSMDGTAAVGDSTDVARANHVHPSDTSRVPTTRKINGMDLSQDRTLTSENIGYNSSTTYSSGTVGKAVSDLNGAINNKMNIAPERIEMYPASGSSHGGYIDFHFGGDTSIDYTTRIMENRSGNIHIYGGMTLGSPLGVGSGGTGNTSVDTTPTQNSTKMVTSGGVYSAIAAAQSVASHELLIHSGTTALELGRAIMIVYGKLFLLHGIVTVTTALSQSTVIYDLPNYNYGLVNMNNNPIIAADNSSYTTVGVDNTNKTLKVTYNGGMQTGRFEMFLMGWIN